MTKYTNARDVLPKELIEEIQKYVKGQHIYIPQNERKEWGTKTGAKEELYKRNKEIFRLYCGGKSFSELADLFHLSVERIKGIVYERKAK